MKSQRFWWGFALALAAVALGVGTLWLLEHRSHTREAQRREKVEARGPRVQVTRVEKEPAQRSVTLPADVRAFQQATLYAKTAGYLREIRVDKGDRVKKDQILAVLESPETDQEVAQARADLRLQEREAARAQVLASRELISQRDFDVAETARRAQQANLSRLRALQRYQVVRAPFDGVITNRYVDPGALIPAGTGSTSGAQPLVDVSDLGRVRVTVFAGQDVAPYLKVGDPVTIDGKQAAHITRFTSALDARSRTMLVEIWLDNDPAHWVPGTYAKVSLPINAPPLPRVPSSAVLMRRGQLTAAVVRDNHIHFVPIGTGLDDGRRVQITSGLEAGMLVGLDVPAELEEGAAIQPVDVSHK